MRRTIQDLVEQEKDLEDQVGVTQANRVYAEACVSRELEEMEKQRKELLALVTGNTWTELDDGVSEATVKYWYDVSRRADRKQKRVWGRALQQSRNWRISREYRMKCCNILC